MILHHTGSRLRLWRFSLVGNPVALLIPAAIAFWMVAALGPAFEPGETRYDLLNRTVFNTPGDDDDGTPSQPSQPTNFPGWISSANGGECRTQSITVNVPAGFSEGEGAVVLCSRPVDFSTIGRPPTLVDSTDFWISIANPNNQNTPQTNLRATLQVRIKLNSEQFDTSRANQLAVMMFDPSNWQWRELPTNWDAGALQLTAGTQQLKPFLAGAPAGMFGRTVFAVIVRGSSVPVPGPSPSSVPTANRNANLRAGPGITFAIVGRVVAGQTLQLDAKSADGRWLRLATGSWIAAFLVDNAPTLPTVSESSATIVPSSSVPTANRNANLRAGPGITFAIVGQVVAGQTLQLDAKSADGRWLRLVTGSWIAAFLVDNAPTTLPYVTNTDDE